MKVSHQKNFSILSLQSFLMIWFPIVIISILHYITGSHYIWLHDILRRLYYIPIIISSYLFGRKGSISSSVTVSLLYFPHAFMSLINLDPAGSVDKGLEIMLYNIIGFITGTIAEKLKKEKDKYKITADDLQEKLEEIEYLEEQLIRAGKLRALGEMTAGLAHEIKNPLASIKASSSIIGDIVPENIAEKKLVDIQKKEIERIQNLLDKFLSFAKPQKIQMSTIDLNDLIDQTLYLLKTQIDQSKISVNFSDKEIVYVDGNREQLSQVLLNVLLNAKDAVKDGGEIKVILKKVERGKHFYTSIEIHDSGRGISENNHDKIFNPFFTTKDNGTGLGLPIANKIVEQHDGYIQIMESDLGGALFVIFLPL